MITHKIDTWAIKKINIENLKDFVSILDFLFIPLAYIWIVPRGIYLIHKIIKPK